MAVTTQSQEYKRLRSYLTPYIKGPVTDAVLNALATSSVYLVNSVQAVNDSLYIVTAQGQYLDLRLADYGITRDPIVGLSDDTFRQIGIQVKNRKQVRDLINNILDAAFGDTFVRATSNAQTFEPYSLQDGDTLLIDFDGTGINTITFKASQFTSIAAATAQEVANAISIGLSNLGVSGSAIVNNDGNGNYVQLLSDTIGASSSVTVFGGRAENILLFPSPVAAGGNFSTQWTISVQSGGLLRFTWTGGADPNVGAVEPGEYVNIFGGGFGSSSNEGSFIVRAIQGGTAGNAYFEIQNFTGTPGIVVQGTNDAVLFFTPVRETLLSKSYYAAVYSTQTNILQIFMPAVTQVIKRSRIGSAHLHGESPPDSGPSLPTTIGPYIYDTQQGFTIGPAVGSLTADFNGGSSHVLTVTDASGFPDQSGYIVLGYGTDSAEGPIPYIARPSDGSILISPAYNLLLDHPSGSSVFLIDQKAPITLAPNGSNYQPYLTDTASGRVYAQNVINSVVAAGITVKYQILFPNAIGLGGWESPIPSANEISYVYGP
jgi:hypothetical protein